MAALARTAAVAAGALLAWAGAGAAAERPALAVTASLGPEQVLFGDRISATVTVVSDRDVVEPASVALVPGFGVLEVLAGPVTERREDDGQATLTLRYELACLGQDCVPSAGPRAVRLPVLRATARARDGRAITATASWPPLSVAGRVARVQAAAPYPPFRLETELPGTTYRIAPVALEAALAVVAAAAAGMLALLAFVALRRRRRRREDERIALLTPLERALLYTREAELRGPDDRRRALSMLARVLGAGDESPELEGAVSRLAWAPPEPSPAATVSVADAIEQRGELGQGHREGPE